LNPSSVSVVFRFLGATPSTSDIRRPLISIIQQICFIYKELEQPSIDDSKTIQDIRRELENILKQIPKDKKLVLLFDSIDQLQAENYDCSKWLPVEYPANIKCIISTIPAITVEQKRYEILEGLKSLVGDDNMIEIMEFDEDLAKEVLQLWLDRDRRCLTQLQMEWLKPKLNKQRGEPTPLFLSLLYDITVAWHSFDDEPDTDFIAITGTESAIEYLYTQLSKKHGEVLFRRAMRYLWLAGGLSEIEMEDMLTAENEVLQSVLVHYLPPPNIFRLPSTLWIRIRNDMSKYLVEKEVDNTIIIYL
jgi:hypothetical protein